MINQCQAVSKIKAGKKQRATKDELSGQIDSVLEYTSTTLFMQHLVTVGLKRGCF